MLDFMLTPTRGIEILGHTLVGYRTDTFPIVGKGGNCFSMQTDAGAMQVLNFGYENLEELLRRGLTLPLKMYALSEHHAVVADPRIGDAWYSTTFCSVCTPSNLLPLPQRLQQLRLVARGQRVERDGWIQHDLTTKFEPFFP